MQEHDEVLRPGIPVLDLALVAVGIHGELGGVEAVLVGASSSGGGGVPVGPGLGGDGRGLARGRSLVGSGRPGLGSNVASEVST